MKPGGTSSTWWVTSTVGGVAGRRRQVRESGDQVLAGAQVESGGGLVEQDEPGVAPQRPGEQHPLALA